MSTAKSIIEAAAQELCAAGHDWIRSRDPQMERLSWADVADEVFARAALLAALAQMEAIRDGETYEAIERVPSGWGIVAWIVGIEALRAEIDSESP